jgi:hypothetical protein
VEHVHLLPAELAVDIGVDVVHRPRPVERDQRGDLLQGRAAHLAQGVAHALGFQLEHADGLAGGQQFVGGLVVERQLVELQLNAAFLQEADGAVEHRQGLEAQEVELHQAGALHPLHVELGRRNFRAGIEV